MSGRFPLKPSIDHTPASNAVIDISKDGASTVFDALGNETALAIICELDQPMTVSDIASNLDVTLQSVAYHIRKLHCAGLVEDVGTWYSKKGREMTVYAPISEQLEIKLKENYQSVKILPGSDERTCSPQRHLEALD